jgi:hypothetical protein
VLCTYTGGIPGGAATICSSGVRVAYTRGSDVRLLTRAVYGHGAVVQTGPQGLGTPSLGTRIVVVVEPV